MSIGSRIKEIRIKRNLTQEQLASQIGVTKGAIANYENSVSTPKIELLYKIFEALDIDANYLYQDDMKVSPEARENNILDEASKSLLKTYRELPEEYQELLIQQAEFLKNRRKK